MKETCDFLNKCRAYFLATIDGDRPRVRPFGTALIFENKLYIMTGKTKPVARQIAANPKVEICAVHGESQTWLRLEAELVEDPRIEAQEAMLDAYPELKGMYTAGDGVTEVLYLKNAKATFCTLSGQSKSSEF
ncbi:MAG: pyridoxamine 5'-phosphate oxidase family protein [Planctomycetia bacterium]|nr:pyridoxamine 5'-phosphate oxidase family protein [Planctomycetia bacterium]